MKLYIYRGLFGEKVPKDVTHVIVDNSVTVITRMSFYKCILLLSVIMGDNVKRIEISAFRSCTALRFIQLSKSLEFIEDGAFYECESLEALFLPSTVKSIDNKAFEYCGSLRLLILPNDIDLSNVGRNSIRKTGIYYQIAKPAGVKYMYWAEFATTDESSDQVNEWLFHHMDEAPFHKLCYSSFVTTKEINYYLHENGNDLALAIDTIHGMTPLHILSMNPHAPPDTIAALLNVNMEAAFRLDNEGIISLNYARDYNVGGLVAMINSLCNYRNSSILVESSTTRHENASKRRKLENN